jgi:hypothetical protein
VRHFALLDVLPHQLSTRVLHFVRDDPNNHNLLQEGRPFIMRFQQQSPIVLYSVMKKQIQKALDVLIGQPLWSSGRTDDLEWFQFGQRRTVKSRRGDAKEVGEYALHIQCAWRIRHGDQVVVGGHDLYYPPEERDDRPEDFDWEVLGANRRDRRIAELFQNETRQFLAGKIEVGEAGSFTILFDDEYALDVLPDDSLSDEHWRLFKPSSEEPHFVVTGKGLKT